MFEEMCFCWDDSEFRSRRRTRRRRWYLNYCVDVKCLCNFLILFVLLMFFYGFYFCFCVCLWILFLSVFSLRSRLKDRFRIFRRRTSWIFFLWMLVLFLILSWCKIVFYLWLLNLVFCVCIVWLMLLLLCVGIRTVARRRRRSCRWCMLVFVLFCWIVVSVRVWMLWCVCFCLLCLCVWILCVCCVGFILSMCVLIL